MRNALLKTGTLLLAAAAVGLWLWPVAEPAPPEAAPSSDLTQPTAAASPASNAAEPEPPAAPEEPPLDAEQLTARAKQTLALNPAGALRDIARADQQAGAEAAAQHEARRALEIHALVRLGQVGHARSLTDRFYRTFPNSERAAELQRLTGYHPRPAAP